jgi:hypothetical protein
MHSLHIGRIGFKGPHDPICHDMMWLLAQSGYPFLDFPWI